jgi:hypothetical protein
MNDAGRTRLVSAIVDEAKMLYSYRAALRVVGNSVRQEAIDRDLTTIYERLIEINQTTKVHTTKLNRD